MRYKLNAVEKARRLLTRDDARLAKKALATSVQEFLTVRSQEAGKAREAAKQARLARKAERSKRYAHLPKPGKYRVEVQTPELGTSVVGGRTIRGNYERRRAAGARGHQERRAQQPRRRDMPRAVEARLDRNRKGWSA